MAIEKVVLLRFFLKGELEEVVNLTNQRGQTALQCAIRSGDPDSVHYLVHNGADVTLADSHKNTVWISIEKVKGPSGCPLPGGCLQRGHIQGGFGGEGWAAAAVGGVE